jgi:malonate transporter MadL subunit
MAIYGVAILAFCLLAGQLAGKLLGWLLGMDSNVGGVGIAMLLLIWLTHRLRKTGHFPAATENGVLFWSSIYIPVIVAMAASGNVRAAIQGGPAAIVAGILVVVICFLLVPLFSRIGRTAEDETHLPK